MRAIKSVGAWVSYGDIVRVGKENKVKQNMNLLFIFVFMIENNKCTCTCKNVKQCKVAWVRGVGGKEIKGEQRAWEVLFWVKNKIQQE